MDREKALGLGEDKGGEPPLTYGMPVEQERYGRIVETHNVCVAAGSRSYIFFIRKDRKNIYERSIVNTKIEVNLAMPHRPAGHQTADARFTRT